MHDGITRTCQLVEQKDSFMNAETIKTKPGSQSEHHVEESPTGTWEMTLLLFALLASYW